MTEIVNKDLIYAKLMRQWNNIVEKFIKSHTGVVVAVVITHPEGMVVLAGPGSNRDYMARRLKAALTVVSQGDYKHIGEMTAYEVRAQETRIIRPS